MVPLTTTYLLVLACVHDTCMESAAALTLNPMHLILSLQLLKTMKAALLKQTTDEVKQCLPEKGENARYTARQRGKDEIAHAAEKDAEVGEVQ